MVERSTVIYRCDNCRQQKRVLYEDGEQKICEVCLMDKELRNDMVANNSPDCRVTAFDVGILTDTTWMFKAHKNFAMAIVFAASYTQTTNKISLDVLGMLTKRRPESEEETNKKLREDIELFHKLGLVKGIEKIDDMERLVISDNFEEAVKSFLSGNDLYAIGIIESLIDNALISERIMQSWIRRGFLETIYNKISENGEPKMASEEDVVNFTCNHCGAVFAKDQRLILEEHLIEEHLIPRDSLLSNYTANSKVIGYKITDDDFQSTMAKYGTPPRTRVDRFSQALKFGALFYQTTFMSASDGEMFWRVKPQIVNYLCHIKGLTRDRINALERTR